MRTAVPVWSRERKTFRSSIRRSFRVGSAFIPIRLGGQACMRLSSGMAISPGLPGRSAAGPSCVRQPSIARTLCLHNDGVAPPGFQSR